MNKCKSLFYIFTALVLAFLVGCAPITPVPDAGTTSSSTESTVAPTEEAEPAEATAEPVEEATPAETAQGAGLANPASEYCTEQGGTLTIEKRGDGGEFGVCNFEDNLQCEEWAMMRGQCPVGGIKVTGYLTPAARYCAITGGEYADNGTTSADDEKGTCTFPGGTVCPAADYYNGTCSAE